MSQSAANNGILLILLGTMLSSIMQCFVKLASDTGIPSTQLVFFRSAFQCVAVVFLMTRSPHLHNPLRIEAPILKLVLARGTLGSFVSLLAYYSARSIPLGDAATLSSLRPVTTIVMASFFLAEKMRWSHAIAAVSSVVGAVLISGPSFLSWGLDIEENTSELGKTYNS